MVGHPARSATPEAWLTPLAIRSLEQAQGSQNCVISTRTVRYRYQYKCSTLNAHSYQTVGLAQLRFSDLAFLMNGYNTRCRSLSFWSLTVTYPGLTDIRLLCRQSITLYASICQDDRATQDRCTYGRMVVCEYCGSERDHQC